MRQCLKVVDKVRKFYYVKVDRAVILQKLCRGYTRSLNLDCNNKIQNTVPDQVSKILQSDIIHK